MITVVRIDGGAFSDDPSGFAGGNGHTGMLTCEHHVVYHSGGVNVRPCVGVRTSLETAVRTAVNDYNTPDKKAMIPYSLHSSKNPHFEQRTTFKGANASGAHPEYMGVTNDYRKDVEEMLEHYFVLNELNGTLKAASQKSK